MRLESIQVSSARVSPSARVWLVAFFARGLAWVGLCLALVVCPAGGQSVNPSPPLHVYHVTFICYPPDAYVYYPTSSRVSISWDGAPKGPPREGQNLGYYLGQAGRELTVSVRGDETTNLKFFAWYPGFQEVSEKVDGLDGISTVEFKDCKALNPWIAIKTYVRVYPYRVASMVVTLLMVYGAGLVTRARVRRLRKEEATARLVTEARVESGTDYNVGRVIGQYRLLERLGEGGMATVYRAVPLSAPDPRNPDAHVALKLMSAAMARDPDFVERFRREVQITTRLRHLNIVQVLDCGEEPGDNVGDPPQLYLVMELVDGTTLQARIAGRPWGSSPTSIRQAVQLYLQPLFDAIAYAHSLGIIHRDLKPENLMVTSGNLLKVMDFGLARQQQSSRKLTRSGTAMGTPAYMPPEQIAGATQPVPASDQYAMGCICYELFTGEVPFTADDPIALMFKHFSDPPEPMRRRVPALPEALDAVVLRMLAKNPEDRFPDVMTALEALREATDCV